MSKLLVVWAVALMPALCFAGPVNVNTADAETLAKELDGVGESKAASIVNYRQDNGDFSSLEELLAVKGVGPALLEKNRDNILFSEAP